MNRFQRQIMMNDGRTLAEHHNEGRGWDRSLWPGPIPVGAPGRVSIEEFERDMAPAPHEDATRCGE
jgi:hypothetical protein